MEKRGKKAQGTMEVPFQMIFSLILIAIFIYAAFTGIKYFMERADQAKIAQFLADVDAKVGTAWQATEMTQTYSFDVPKRVEMICFGDMSKSLREDVCPEFDVYKDQAVQKGANMFLCPPRKVYSVGAPIYHSIRCNGNPCVDFKQDLYCVKNDGKISITLEKSIGSSKVILS